MWRLLKMLLIAVILGGLMSSIKAQLTTTLAGGKGGGSVGVNCGTGVIDLSTGCVQPMLGVL